MADYIKVDSDKLRQLASSVRTRIGVINGEFDNIMSVVAGTTSYWQGDAADTYRAVLSSKNDKVSDFMRRLEEYVDDLSSMSTVYDVAETQSQQISADLETDVIF